MAKQSTPRLGIIADDFTGATLVAAMLEGRGVAAPLIFSPEAIRPDEPAPVLVGAARSRTGPAAEALAQIGAFADAMARAGCHRLAYKACASFDSTVDGNIGPAADLLAARAGRGPVLMSAGFPAFNATVHQGYLFYRGRLVSESIKRLDPLTPMEDPDLCRFIGRQTPHPVALLAHSRLAAGEAAAMAALEALIAAGAAHVLCDTSDDGDVEMTARLAEALDLPVAASDPLIVALALRLAAGRASVPGPAALPPGPVAVLAGSTGPVVMAQLAALEAQVPVLTLDLLGAGQSAGGTDVPDDAQIGAQIAGALDWAAAQSGPLCISTACDAEGLHRTQAALGALGAARRAEALLGGVARGLAARGQRRFAVAGGETSGAVVAALGVRRARALPEGPLGAGFCLAEAEVPLGLYLKSGKIGGDDILLRAARGEGFGR